MQQVLPEPLLPFVWGRELPLLPQEALRSAGVLEAAVLPVSVSDLDREKWRYCPDRVRR